MSQGEYFAIGFSDDAYGTVGAILDRMRGYNVLVTTSAGEEFGAELVDVSSEDVGDGRTGQPIDVRLLDSDDEATGDVLTVDAVRLFVY